MRHLKRYNNFKPLNEALEETTKTKSDTGMIPLKGSITSSGELSIVVDGEPIKFQMEKMDKFGEAKNQSDSKNEETQGWFKIDAWGIKLSEMRNKLGDKGDYLNAYNYKGESLNKAGTKTNAYLLVSVPEGYSGELQDGSKINNAEIIGHNSGHGGAVFSQPGETNWGFYFYEEYLTSELEKHVYRKIRLEKESIAHKSEGGAVKLKSKFDFDKSELNQAIKSEMKAKLDPSLIKGVVIKTGASLDGKKDDMIDKNGKQIRREDWDIQLVKNRYKELIAYLKELGIEARVSKSVKTKSGAVKVYGVFSDKIGKNEENRTIALKSIPK